MILTKVSRLRGLLHRKFPSLEVRHFSEGIGELDRSQEPWCGSILPTSTKCGALFVSKEVTPIVRGDRCGRCKEQGLTGCCESREPDPCWSGTPTQRFLINSLVLWVWQPQIMDPLLRPLALLHWVLELISGKDKEVYSSFSFFFTYFAFMFMNNNNKKECQHSLWH